jgi:hypothetical protein
MGSSEGQSPFDGGFGGVPQSQNSPKIGGYKGVEKGLVNPSKLAVAP